MRVRRSHSAEGEHADAFVERAGDAPGRDRRQQHLGVAMPAPARRDARALQLGAQLGVVVDLAVEGEHPAPGLRQHRLLSGGGQVDDREPAMRERDAGLAVGPHAVVVGAAMRDGIGHMTGDELLAPRVRSADETRYAAHLGCRYRCGAGLAISEPGERLVPPQLIRGIGATGRRRLAERAATH